MGQKVPYQGRYVRAAFPQGRHRDHEGVEPIEEVLAEFTPLGHAVQVAVSGGDDSDLRRKIRGAAQTTVAFGLQDAQELGLYHGRQLADLIQKQGATLGLLDQPRFFLGGPGEGPTLMAKEFRLEQGLRQGGTVHRHQGPLGPGLSR